MEKLRKSQKIRRKRKHGFRQRSKRKSGRMVLKRRRGKGRIRIV